MTARPLAERARRVLCLLYAWPDATACTGDVRAAFAEAWASPGLLAVLCGLRHRGLVRRWGEGEDSIWGITGAGIDAAVALHEAARAEAARRSGRGRSGT